MGLSDTRMFIRTLGPTSSHTHILTHTHSPTHTHPHHPQADIYIKAAEEEAAEIEAKRISQENLRTLAETKRQLEHLAQTEAQKKVHACSWIWEGERWSAG